MNISSHLCGRRLRWMPMPGLNAVQLFLREKQAKSSEMPLFWQTVNNLTSLLWKSTLKFQKLVLRSVFYFINQFMYIYWNSSIENYYLILQNKLLILRIWWVSGKAATVCAVDAALSPRCELIEDQKCNFSGWRAGVKPVVLGLEWPVNRCGLPYASPLCHASAEQRRLTRRVLSPYNIKWPYNTHRPTDPGAQSECVVAAAAAEWPPQIYKLPPPALCLHFMALAKAGA